MLIEFDTVKREKTLLDRGLDFADCHRIFSGLHFIARDDRFEGRGGTPLSSLSYSPFTLTLSNAKHDLAAGSDQAMHAKLIIYLQFLPLFLALMPPFGGQKEVFKVDL